MEFAKQIDVLVNKWNGGCEEKFDYEQAQMRITLCADSIVLFFREGLNERYWEDYKEQIIYLWCSLAAPCELRSVKDIDGILVTCYPNGKKCSLAERMDDDIAWNSLIEVFDYINNAYMDNFTPKEDDDILNFVKSFELPERKNSSADLIKVEPIEGQRSITDNAVWWITKAMQSNKGIEIADTKTAEGLKITLNKANDKLYEKRSLSRTRTEIKSLKEFLQQLLDSVPEPKN